MPDFTLTQSVLAVVILLFFILFYLRRSWFWFWKVSKLFKQFEELEKTTQSTNQEVMELSRKLTKLLVSVEDMQSRSADRDTQ